uniref:Putative homing endonuclease n=1 Tax=viral metagenome TaxID=1070528 RepID=A0A6H1Z8Y0_9ZZZZ
MIDYVIEYDIETDIAKVVEVEHSNGKKKYPDFVYENVIAIARQRFIEIEDFRSRDELPEREFDREDWQCLSPDTLIILANGKYKEISKIQKGDIVKSINGTTKVKYVGCKKSDKQWVCVKPIGLLDIVCTEDHRWLIAQWESATKYHTKEAFIPEYIEAKNIPLAKNRKYAVVLIPVHKPCFVHTELNIEECKFLGFYVAEGCLANWQNEKYYRVIFTIHENETALANEIINLGISLFSCNHTNEVIIDKRTGWKSRRIIFNSVHMVNFIRSHITGKAINKELSSSIMGARDKCIKAFLDAAIIGDGYINPKQKSTTLSTSSKKLCLQYQQLFWRLGIPAIAQYASKPSKRMGYETVQGYRVQYQGNYHVIQFININGTTFAASRIRNITPIEERYDAWDLEVESKMHNFSTHSGIVHNCDYCLYGSKCYEGYEREFNAMTEDATLEGSIVELCSLYLEQVNYEKDAKTHKEELNAKIKDILRSQNIRKGKTGQGIPGDYTINWRLQHEERIMPKAEIPDDILPRILKQSIKEILTIRKIPAKKEG